MNGTVHNVPFITRWKRLRYFLPGSLVLMVLAATPDPLAAFQAEWNELIAAAQKEGKLVIIGTFTPRRILQSPGSAGAVFAKKFGIKVIVSGGSGREVADRILAERRGRKFTVDISMMGAGTTSRRMIPAKAHVPIKPLLKHPEVIDESLWFGGKHQYYIIEGETEPRPEMFIHNAGITYEGLPEFYNTNLVSEDEIRAIKDPWDFLTDRWKGKIVSWPPDEAGGGFTTSALIFYGEKWTRYFLNKMDVFWTIDSRTMIDGLGGGRFDAAYGVAVGRDMRSAIRDGLPIAEVTPEIQKLFNVQVRTLSPGGSGYLMMMDRAPHPNAAKLWINWLLSRKGQMAWNASTGATPSLREDIPSGDQVDPWDIRQPGQRYMLRQASVEHQRKQKQLRKRLLELYRESRQ